MTSLPGKILIISFFFAIVFFSISLNSENVDLIVEKGKIEYRKKDFKKAYLHFKKAMGLHPNHAEGMKWFWKMKNEFDTNKFEEMDSSKVIIKRDLVDKTDLNKHSKKNNNVRKKVKRKSKRRLKRKSKGRPKRKSKQRLKKELKHELKKELMQELEQESKQELIPASIKALYLPIIIFSSFILLILTTIVLCVKWYQKIRSKIPVSPVGINEEAIIIDTVIPKSNAVQEMSSGYQETILQLSRDLLNKPSVDQKGMNKILSTMSTDGDDRIRNEAQQCLYLESVKDAQHVNDSHSIKVPDENNINDIKMEARGILFLLESKLQRLNNEKRVRELAREIAIRMRLSDKEIREILMVSIFKDTGFLLLPDRIFFNTSLSADDWRAIYSHPEKSAHITESLSFQTGIVESIKLHHERHDGSGYPRKISGKEIPMSARIVSLSDSFIAMISDRPFRERKIIKDAVDRLRDESHRYDPEVFDIFLDIIRKKYKLADNIMFEKVNW